MDDSEEYLKIWQERQQKKGIKNYELGSKIGQLSSGQTRLRRGEEERTPSDTEDHPTGKEFEEMDHGEIEKEKKHIKTRKTARKVLKHSGTFIFWLSLTATFIILLPFLGIGTKKQTVQNKPEPTIKAESEDIEAKVIKEATALGLDARYSLYVPKIDAKSVVIENIDMGKESEYLKALQKGVAHGKGTYFPGQGGNIFLFSHSVSAPEYIQTYNAVFYDLKNLEAGDEIIIYFSGAKYVYKVTEKAITNPRDVSFLTKDYGGETLILQTCDPPGTTLRRLLVIAKPVTD